MVPPTTWQNTCSAFSMITTS
uniref:Uncharacterized protein n=1 Tax=Ralstonia solanacearum TaxID=305 RepID=A0A0S4TLT5_RALSL|nr:protein of unknown function [Ralstonia solanacearum]